MSGCTTCEAKRRLNNPDDYTEEEIREAEEILKASRQSAESMTLDSLYAAAYETPGDINEHVPKLKELASECQHVTDIGMRPDVSSVALLAGQPDKIVHVLSNAQRAKPWMTRAGFEHVRGKTQVHAIVGNTPAIDLREETDLLFLDTKHTANRIYLELEKYAPLVRRYIVRHDTQIYGEKGEDGGPGLRVGILQYLKEHPEWSVIYDTPDQYGLMVLSRDARDKQELPSVARQVFNFSRHLFNAAATGAEHVPEDVFNNRLDACLMCPLRVENRCSKCGCYLDHNEALGTPGKAAYAAEECPINKWGKHFVGEGSGDHFTISPEPNNENASS